MASTGQLAAVVSAREEQKSEESESSISREPSFRDSEALADASVTAEEAAVMADFSEHARKKEKKKKSKKKRRKPSSTKSRSRSRSHTSEITDESGNEETDGERRKASRSSSAKRKKKKSTRKKSRSRPDMNGERSPSSSELEKKRRPKREKKKDSKRKKQKRKKKSKASKDGAGNEHADGDVAANDHVVQLALDQEGRRKSDNDEAFPPELDSDSSSSELPDPSDLDVDDESPSEYESDTTTSSLEQQERSLVPLLGLLRDSRSALETADDELSALSMHSLPPQAIPGSLAQEVLESPSEHHPMVEVDQNDQKILGKRRFWRCWIIFGIAILLAAAVVIVVVLLTKKKDTTKTTAHILPVMKGTMDLAPYNASTLPDFSALSAWDALTKSSLETVLGNDPKATVQLDSLDIVDFHRSNTIARSTESGLTIKFLMMFSAPTGTTPNDIQVAVDNTLTQLEQDPVYLDSLSATSDVFGDVRQVNVRAKVLSTNLQGLESCSRDLVQADANRNKNLNYAEFFNFLMVYGDCRERSDLNAADVRQFFGDFQSGSGNNGALQQNEIDIKNLDKSTLRRICAVSNELVAGCRNSSPSLPVAAPSVGGQGTPSTTLPSVSPAPISMTLAPQLGPSIPPNADLQPLASILDLAPDNVPPRDPAAKAAFAWLLNENRSLNTLPGNFFRTRFSLAALYYATDGNQWATNSRWLSSLDVCKWFGVLCNQSGAVESLILSRNALSNSLPTELSLLTSLAELDLGMNTIGFSLPTEIGEMTSLSHLDLTGKNHQNFSCFGVVSIVTYFAKCPSGCNFSGDLPSELGNLSFLTHLGLSENAFNGTLPTELGLLSQLSSFEVSSNHLLGSLPSELGAMTMLTLLSLNANHFVRALPTEIAFLVRLQEFNGMNNTFGGNLPSELGMMTALTVLRLYANGFGGRIPSTLGNLVALEELSLYDNMLSGAIPTELGLLAGSLNSLDLHDNSLTGNLNPIFCSKSLIPGYLAADCSGSIPKVTCSCCTNCY